MSASSLNVVGQIVGYVRVSAADQNPARQLAAIGDVHRLFSEAASGKNTDRPKLAEMIAYVRAGDTVLVKVEQRGGACHTGDRTCFDNDLLLAPQGGQR